MSDAARSGRPASLSEEQLEALKDLVVAGPDVERDGVVRWRCVDLRSVIKERFDVDVHERTVGKLLHRIGLSHVQPRPYHPQKDAEAQVAFKNTLRRV